MISLIGRVIRYILAFIFMFYAFTQIINAFVTDHFVVMLADFFGTHHGIENLLDTYYIFGMSASALLAVIILYAIYKYRRYKDY